MKIYIAAALSIGLALSGCANRGKAVMTPVKMVTAEEENEIRMEVIPVAQVLRPMDELDVIFHLRSASETEYRIQPGDEVNIRFLSANELSSPYIVLPDGTIDMPYVGALKISGLTVKEVQNEVVQRFGNVLRNPQVQITVPRPMAQQESLRATLNSPGTGMSRIVLVGADGRAAFPLIGSLSVLGKTVDEVRAEVNKRYEIEEQGQIKADVLLKSTKPNEVYVLGEVAQPGAYPITRPVSVLEALSFARGTNPNAQLSSAVIMRRQGDEAIAYVYDVKKAMRRKALQMAYLQPDDLLYIPQTKLSKAGQISRQIADVILFQSVGVSLSYRLDNKKDY